jgi:hypothetical protein
MKIGEMNFRQLGNNLIVIKSEKAIKQIRNIEFPKESDSVLSWCYFDSECGITFEFLCPFNSENKQYYEVPGKNFSFKWRKGAVNEYDAEIVPTDMLKSSDLLEYIRSIIKNYEYDDELNKTRMIREIDHLREKDFPDDILVTLFKKNTNPEALWVRLLSFKDSTIIGKLLNEPNSDFGVHLGDMIKLEFYKDNEDVLRAGYICKI